ncbi:MAG TPA: tRNA (adenosine(37)-N6)-threonylcarbamoyltransferase complex transferase subunit TsaD [Phycisphaerales bacterium]|nr:tRNA (adenosine(37)-N6)-threonylcarbamoyltransferase complex transferase subunit TsaD [Phycisphaerales bacterium]
MIDGETILLGVETSCDETACALVADGRRVLSNAVATQIDLHARFGGVVPEIASRAHIEAINTVIDKALSDAAVRPEQISAVAVTREPGLIGSLLVGVMAAKTLAWTWRVPLVGVNHVYAHAYAAALDAEPIEYPAAALICSGGHTALYRCGGPLDLELLGTTIDDAAGEAFDKVASILRLGYPGGPVIDRLSRDANPQAVHFPRTLLAGQSLDFSFSGLKTAVLYHVNGVPGTVRRRSPAPAGKTGIENFSEREIADIAASFQQAVVDVLTIKLRRAARKIGARTLVLGGGVAANSALRTSVAALAEKLGCTLRLPPMRFCLDNGAMVAGLAYHSLRVGQVSDLALEARATVRR